MNAVFLRYILTGKFCKFTVNYLYYDILGNLALKSFRKAYSKENVPSHYRKSNLFIAELSFRIAKSAIRSAFKHEA